MRTLVLYIGESWHLWHRVGSSGPVFFITFVLHHCTQCLLTEELGWLRGCRAQCTEEQVFGEGKIKGRKGKTKE